jgi:hypothetical protein
MVYHLARASTVLFGGGNRSGWSTTPPVFANFRGTLDGKGEATASFNVPSGLPALNGFTLHHAYIVYDNSGKFHMASNAVPLTLK